MPKQEHGTLTQEAKDPASTSLEGTGGPELNRLQVEAQRKDPLKELKAQILSIDWEITDKVMTRFIAEVEKLKAVYKADKVFSAFLQILHSLGAYVKNKKGKAHPDAIKLLNSVYNSFEKVVLLEAAPEAERRRILFAEVERFKRLKQEIAHRRSSTGAHSAISDKARGPETLKAESPSRPGNDLDIMGKEKVRPRETEGPERLQSNQLLLAAIEEIKDYITGELNSLKAELRHWMEEFSKSTAHREA